ncbi:hypothetical protein [Nocardia sp. BMG111209]|uniref:hypothetical protein n=1 Tax=Nocardia sp. BMG111209 TaxID=1160137 RepID=UPI00037529D8|nr:hypothetical protein [Nocardia sp. BMG111209]
MEGEFAESKKLMSAVGDAVAGRSRKAVRAIADRYGRAGGDLAHTAVSADGGDVAGIRAVGGIPREDLRVAEGIPVPDNPVPVADLRTQVKMPVARPEPDGGFSGIDEGGNVVRFEPEHVAGQELKDAKGNVIGVTYASGDDAELARRWASRGYRRGDRLVDLRYRERGGRHWLHADTWDTLWRKPGAKPPLYVHVASDSRDFHITLGKGVGPWRRSTALRVDGATLGRILVQDKRFGHALAATDRDSIVLLSGSAAYEEGEAARSVAGYLHGEAGVTADVYAPTARIWLVAPDGWPESELRAEIMTDPEDEYGETWLGEPFRRYRAPARPG